MALTDYVLARGATLDDLQKSVLAYAADGFVPSGGIQADAQVDNSDAGAKVNALLASLRTAFLSCLCGSERCRTGAHLWRSFLSCLCGSELGTCGRRCLSSLVF